MIGYLVMGEAGAYDDWRVWPIKVYFNKERAKEHVNLATNRLKKILLKHEPREAEELGLFISEYDPKSLGSAWDIPTYHIKEVDIEKEII
jgi:hypothetical protein